VEKELVKLSPKSLPERKESTKVLTESFSEVKIVFDNKTLEKLHRLKNLLAHKINQKESNMAELIDLLASEALERHEPVNKKQREKSPSPEKVNTLIRSRHIPTKIRNQVWLRDQGKCTFKDPLTNKICNSSYKIQFDHALPWAMGGEHTIKNLRPHCVGHNLWHAVQFYGKEKMEKYQSVPNHLEHV
jgi:5-methylcytosine-specific restriction endonuclease McrA